MLKIIREVVFVCATHNIQIKAIHLPGVSNRKADFLSRAPVNKSIDILNVMGPEATRLEVTNTLFELHERW